METMLRALPPGRLHGRLQSLPATPPASLCVRTEKRFPLLRVLGSLGIPNGANSLFCRRAFLCSEPAGDEPEQPVEPSSPIVLAGPRPEDHLSVLALPLPFRPLFPGFYIPVIVKDPELLQALAEICASSAPFAGAFLIKDEPGTDGSESETCIHYLQGKELFKRLHEVGTLAQIASIEGEQVVLIGHQRLRITGMVGEDPLTVKVDHLKDLPYDRDDDIIKATSFEVISTLREVLKTSSLWRDHAQIYTQLPTL